MNKKSPLILYKGFSLSTEKYAFEDSFNGEIEIKLDLNLRPQNLDFDTYYKLTIEYEKLRS